MSPRSRGFVLVNALVLVAALAGIAVVLLGWAEGARVRAAQTQSAAQTRLYLDAFEALALTLLAADQQAGGMDHAGEAWARAEYDVALDRGRVTGDIIDLQGRFNVNWLANPSDTLAHSGFEALVARLGLSPTLADAVIAFLSPGGPSDTAAYARQSPPIAPVGGPVLMLDQLLAMPEMRPEAFARLRPYLSAVPAEQPLNVNTASGEVLQSLIPSLNAAVTDRLLQARRLAPFQSVDDFLERLGDFGIFGAVSEENLARIGVGSAWFAADITATLEDQVRHRVTVIRRQPLPVGPLVAYRLNDVP